jgi:hypothetical protein
MKKREIKTREIHSRYVALQDFIESDFFRLHEIMPDDPQFKATINQLHQLVIDLKRAI